jgi:hypothetical protein
MHPREDLWWALAVPTLPIQPTQRRFRFSLGRSSDAKRVGGSVTLAFCWAHWRLKEAV